MLLLRFRAWIRRGLSVSAVYCTFLSTCALPPRDSSSPLLLSGCTLSTPLRLVGYKWAQLSDRPMKQTKAGLHVSFVRAAFLFVACSRRAQLPRSCPTKTRMDAFRCTLDLMARRGTKSVVIQIEAKNTGHVIRIEPTAARNGGGGSFAQEGSGEPAVGSNQIIYVRITSAIQIIVNQWSVHPRWGLRHLRIQTFERLRGGSRGLVGRTDRTVEGRARPITEVHPARRLNTRTQRGAWEGDGGSRCNTCIYNGWIGGADD